MLMRQVVAVAVLMSSAARLSGECSRKGYLYEADELLGLYAACECVQCYSGDRCETLSESCELQAGLEVDLPAVVPWFDETASVDLQANYHSNYLTPWLWNPAALASQSRERLTATLNETIRDLHRAVGNAETDGYTIVWGPGAMGLISGVAQMLATEAGTEICAPAPYWGTFGDIIGDLANASFTSGSECDVELITSPNNPDGARVEASGPVAVHDFVYRWPHLSALANETRADDIMIFSLSKLAGFAATRFGWALFKDADLATAVDEYLFHRGGVSVEGLYKATRVLRAITASVGTPNDFFAFGAAVSADRWARLRAVVGTARGFLSLRDTVPGLPYAWLRCDYNTTDCSADFLAHATLLVGPGTSYGDPDNTKHVRLLTLQDEPLFGLMLHRISTGLIPWLCSAHTSAIA